MALFLGRHGNWTIEERLTSHSCNTFVALSVEVLQPGDVQDAALGVHLVKFHPAGFRDAEAMPEHQEQQATVAGLVPAALGRLDPPFNLAPVRCFGSLSFPPVFPLLRPFIILSRVPPCDAPETRINRAVGFSTIDNMIYFVES